MIRIADRNDIEFIVKLRTEQQIEDWNFTSPDKDYSVFANEFSNLTREYLIKHMNKNIFFAIMMLEDNPVAMCAIESLDILPQITSCEIDNVKVGEVAAVFTRKQYRGNGYQQKLLRILLDFAKKQGFSELVLTTNTKDAQHIYRKLGFRYISNKYYLKI